MLVLDDLGDWRGLGTALHLAESGHEVTIVTSAPVVAGGLAHSAADGPLRKRFRAAGGTALTTRCVLGWGDGRRTDPVDLDRDVIAVRGRHPRHRGDRRCRRPRSPTRLSGGGIAYHAIGDVVAPRRASLAFYEARELALRL